MELFDILSVFLNDKPEMKLLQTLVGQAFVSYLTDFFEKLNIFDFIAFLQLCQKIISAKKLTNFTD
jgi:hypothetical protein